MNYTDTDYEIHVYLDALWRRRRLLLLVILVTLFLAVLSSRLISHKYMASTSIAININALPAMRDVSTPTEIGERFQELKAFTTSPANLQKIVVDTGVVKKNANPLAIKSAADLINKGLSINLLEKNVIEIVLIQNRPKLITEILNNISHSMIQQLNTQESKTAGASLSALRDSLQMQKQKLKKSIEALTQYENQYPDALPEFSDIYQNQLRQITTDISKQQGELSAIKAEKEELEKSLLKINPMITEIDGAILDNEIKLSKLRLIYTDNYSGIKTLIQLNQSLKADRDKRQKEFQTLDENKIQQLWNLTLSKPAGTEKNGNFQLLGSQLEKLMSMQLKLKGMTQEISSLTEQKKSINKKLRQLNETKQKYIELKQNIKDNQTAYEGILSRNTLANMSEDLSKNEQYSAARVVSYPEIPTNSLSRPISFFFILGLVAGTMGGIALITVLELIDDHARNKRALKDVTGFEVLCRVGGLTTQ